LCLAACSKHDDYKYKITGIALRNVDGSGITPVDAATDSIPARAYGIKVLYSGKLSSNANTDWYESRSSIQYPVTSFVIYSLTDFDSTHKALVPITGYFQQDNYINDTLTAAACSYLFNLSVGGVNNKDTSSGNFTLLLMQPPATTGRRAFVVSTTFADNTNLSDTIWADLY